MRILTVLGVAILASSTAVAGDPAPPQEHKPPDKGLDENKKKGIKKKEIVQVI